MGARNGYTKSAVGFDGDSAISWERFLSEELRRVSQCTHQRFIANGQAMLTHVNTL